MRNQDWRRAAIIITAGAFGSGVLWVGVYAALLIIFYDWAWIGSNPGAADILQWSLFFTVPPLLFSVGGALPARALGVEWRWSLLISLGAHALSIPVLAGMVFLAPFEGLEEYAAALFIPAGTLTAFLATRYINAPPSFARDVSIIAASIILFVGWLALPYIVVTIAASFLAWTLLPILATLPQTR